MPISAGSESVPAASGEHRVSSRKRALLSGKVVYDEGAYSLDCTIRDISTTGARITISQGQYLPATVYLLDIRNHTAHEANVVWRRAPLFGLLFVKSYPDLSAPHLQFLRRIWIECASR